MVALGPLSKLAAALGACAGSVQRGEHLPGGGEGAQGPHPSVTAAVWLGTLGSSPS